MIAPIEHPEYYLDGVKLDKIKQLEEGLYVAFVDFPDGEGTFHEAQEVVRAYLHLKGENGTINEAKTKQLEVHGSHCSCYGFEGQFSPEKTDLNYLKSDKFNFCCGGCDDSEDENKAKVKDFIKNLF